MNKSFINETLKLYFHKFKVLSFQQLSEGAENANFLINASDKRMVLRVLGQEHSIVGKRTNESICYELEFMNYLSTKSLPVCFSYKSLNGNWFETLKNKHGKEKVVLLEYIEGQMLEKVSSTTVGEIAKVMAKMHNASETFKPSYKRKWPGTILEITDLRIKDFEKLKDKEINDLPNKQLFLEFIDKYKKTKKLISTKRLRVGPIHGDLKIENLKFKKNKLIGVFDFDDCRESYFIEDIANSIVFNINNKDKSLLSTKEDRIKIFIKSYEKIRKLKSSEKRVLNFIFLARIIELILKDYLRYKKGKKFFMNFRIKDYFKYAEIYKKVFV